MQIVYLLCYCIVIGLPFLFGAFIIGLSLFQNRSSIIYGFNLLGSGLGTLAVIITLYLWHPFTLIKIVSIISILPLLFYANYKKLNQRLITICFIISYSFLILFYFNVDIKDSISEYKPISKVLLLPNSKIETSKYSPLSITQTVSAKGLRTVAGLSLTCPHVVPEQKMIFFDGSSSTPITPYSHDTSSIKYLDYTPSSLPYHLLKESEREKLLIIGVGGGEGILKGILYSFKNIEGVEIDKSVIKYMTDTYNDYSGNIYNLSNVKIHSNEARGFIKASKNKYDLIDISMIDAYNNASSGIYAMNETYLYTTDAISDFYNRLSDNGILAISRWIDIPPKNGIKMINTCISALKNMGIKKVEDHIVFIRSIQSATFLIFKSPVSEIQLRKTKEFCNSRYFDIIYQKNITAKEVNKFIKLSEPAYFNAARTLISSNKIKKTISAPFNLTPATDNQPYFYNFFNYNTLKHIISNGAQTVPVVDWGYLILIILLIPISISALIFIIIPLFLMPPKEKLLLREIILFTLLGLGFFFIEMPLIQKFILFLSHPVFSISIIIATLLIFSGIGSFYSNTFFKGSSGVLYISLVISGYLLFLHLLFNNLLLNLCYLPFLIKGVLAVIVVAPLAFLMGIPFPKTIEMVKKTNADHFPWLWGINGFSSVISIIVASILAIEFGFNFVLLIASFCYLGVGIITFSLYNYFKYH